MTDHSGWSGGWNDPGWNAPPGPPPPTPIPAQAPLLQIGDMAISPTEVFTPNGAVPLAGSVWIVADLSRTEEKVPTWAVITAVVTFFLCFLGLFFLLVKEPYTTGYVEVRMQSGQHYHVTQIPAVDASTVQWVRHQVAQAQMMAQRA